jgi:hypothetical protein
MTILDAFTLTDNVGDMVPRNQIFNDVFWWVHLHFVLGDKLVYIFHFITMGNFNKCIWHDELTKIWSFIF